LALLRKLGSILFIAMLALLIHLVEHLRLLSQLVEQLLLEVQGLLQGVSRTVRWQVLLLEGFDTLLQFLGQK
jgi:hypothetical protein